MVYSFLELEIYCMCGYPMRIFTYHTNGGKDLILKYLDSLPNDESALGYAIIDRLSKF